DEIKRIDKSIKAKAIIAYIFEHVETNAYHFEKRNDLMFVGGFTHTPNVDAVIWFGEEVMPKIVEKIPDIKWYVMGSNPPRKVVEMASDNIIVKGFVSDEELEEYYNRCRMSIVPLRYGAGIKGKVVEAMRYGIPVVTTSVGAEGIIGAEDILCIADDADALAKVIITKYNNKEFLKQVSAKSYEYIKNNFSQENAWNVVKADFL
ncbi:MAG: glycosyltransferase family 4 protein, partial [Lachnospiraceae bacterium]|nr:glycosyltransferase family 4 protein [Lachnospiraceae bacterium]